MTDLAALEAAIADRENVAPPIVGGAPLRASWAGACARQIGYKLRHEPETEALSAQSAIAFAVGTAIHEQLQWALQRLHPDGAAEVEGSLEIWDNKIVRPNPLFPLEVMSPAIGCHADFAYGKVVIEIKSMQPYAFDKAVREGAQEHHVLQVGLNGLAQGAEVVVLIYVDKAKGRIATFELGADPWKDKATAEALRLASIWGLWSQGHLADPIDPARKVWQCRYCPFLTTCKQSAQVEGDPF